VFEAEGFGPEFASELRESGQRMRGLIEKSGKKLGPKR
jgi:hypothetical protein